VGRVLGLDTRPVESSGAFDKGAGMCPKFGRRTVSFEVKFYYDCTFRAGVPLA